MINLREKISLISAIAFLSPLLSFPVLAAEKITFFVAPFGQFDVSVEDLVLFSKEGKITPSFSYYAKKVTPEELSKFRSFLTKSFTLNEIEAYNFFQTNFGQEIIRELSTAISDPEKESQLLLQGAIISAAANPQGFKIIDVLQKYDSPTLSVNLQRVKNLVNEADQIYETGERIFNWLDQQASQENLDPKLGSISNLDQPGSVQWKKQTLIIPRQNKDPLTVYVYLPQNLTQPASTVVIAPGLNSDFQAFSYLGEHLASHGFAVLGFDFPESDNQRMMDALQGLDIFPSPNAWMNQPKDISKTLDIIEEKTKSDPNWQGKIDVNNVGILGHSLGGYTATAIGGAQVSWDNILKECSQLNNPDKINLNPAFLWQCQGVNSTPPIANLRDKRIKAVIAVNPVTNPTFGQNINQLKIPTLLIAGSDDVFAPPLPEQINPFSFMEQDDRYLVLIKNSTHLSFSQGTENLPKFIVGEGQSLAFSYLKALSLAFFNVYLNNQEEFAPYLTESALQKMSQEPLPIHLIKSLTPEQLNEALKLNE